LQIEIENWVKKLGGRQQPDCHPHNAEDNRGNNEVLYNLVVVVDFL
jgi:hypothetical protein